MFLPYVPNYHCFVSIAAEPWPENATLYQQLKGRYLFTIKNVFASKYIYYQKKKNFLNNVIYCKENIKQKEGIPLCNLSKRFCLNLCLPV